jgi:glycosyltransferase involved in cell wall biosynthesis
MKVSIVIPSFNQGEFLEQTLESVFAQDAVEREVLVFDGGSTDQTAEVLRRYDSRLAYWESKPDRGQTHAINKGLARMTGDVWMYLNSDDLLVPGALAMVSDIFADPSVMWVSGACETFDDTGIVGGVRPGLTARMKNYLAPWNRGGQYVFPFSGACYLRREVFDRLGFFDESYCYSMDIEYYCRAIFEGGFRQTMIDDVLGKYRLHCDSKTVSRGIAYGFRSEEVRIAQRYEHYLSPKERAELNSEIGVQLRWLPIRESIWLLSQGKRRDALSLILHAARMSPSLLVFRPWLGALRRIWAGSPQAISSDVHVRRSLLRHRLLAAPWRWLTGPRA